jgi:DnaA N-terminal domain
VAKLYVTPLMRVVWHEMLVDAVAKGAVPAITVPVCIQIGRHFNNNTAETYVSQATIAAELNYGERQVWKAIKAAQSDGLLNVRHGGRRSNFYSMPIERVALECDIYLKKYRTRVRTSEGKSSHSTPAKVALEREGTLDPSDNSNAAALENSLGALGDQLRARLGDDEFRSWFASVTVQEATEGRLTLEAPTKFYRNKIATRYADTILELAQREMPTIERVEIVERRGKGPAMMKLRIRTGKNP